MNLSPRSIIRPNVEVLELDVIISYFYFYSHLENDIITKGTIPLDEDVDIYLGAFNEITAHKEIYEIYENDVSTTANKVIKCLKEKHIEKLI